MSVSIGGIKKRARWSLKGKWGAGILLTIIMVIINSGIPLLVQALIGGGFDHSINQETPSLPESFANFIISLLLVPFNISVYWFYLGLVRFEDPKISDVFLIFANGPKYLKLIGLSLLSGIFIFLWSLLLIIPGIIKSISYSQACFLLKDHPELSVLEAITESRRRMNGHKWKYFFLGLSFIGWTILSLLTFGIGFLWLTPYITTSLAAFYHELIADVGLPQK